MFINKKTIVMYLILSVLVNIFYLTVIFSNNHIMFVWLGWLAGVICVVLSACLAWHIAFFEKRY